MLNRLREARKNEHGFTLIELLIVIVILGILAAIVVFSVKGITDKGNASACKSDAKNVEVATEAYYAGHNSTYPPGTDTATRIASLTGANLLREAPSTTNGYTINLDAAGNVTATGACTIP